jgi:hypothetical protein
LDSEVIRIQYNTIDHDRLFKELLENFFEEFITLFFPETRREIDFTDYASYSKNFLPTSHRANGIGLTCWLRLVYKEKTD